MITLRRAHERRHVRGTKDEIWWTFLPASAPSPGVETAPAEHFGALEGLEEQRLAPRAVVALLPDHDAEIVTYVLDGAIEQGPATGAKHLVHAGELHRMTVRRGVWHGEANTSRTHAAHVFRLRLRPSRADREATREPKRFYAADRRGKLCVVASPDGRAGSLCIHAFAVVCSAVLEPGQHVVHELARGRRAWLHVVRGEATLAGLILRAGDGAGVTGDRALSITARDPSEILLLDLGARPEGVAHASSSATVDGGAWAVRARRAGTLRPPVAAPS
ncbi:MAG: pirin family protein [Myxococcales bacterium]|nr:pirin family protein [Myxococcales bacterium]